MIKRRSRKNLALCGRIQEALFAWLEPYLPHRSIAVTLTFDPQRSTAYRDRSKAEREFAEFKRFVNQKAYHSAFSRHGKQLTVIPVLEGGGSTGKHYHYHALIEVPHYTSAAEFIEVLQQAWAKQSGKRTQIECKECRNSDWLRYMLKDRDKEDLLDAVDVCNLSLNKVMPLQSFASFGTPRGKQGSSKPAPLIAAALPESHPDAGPL